MHIVVTEELVCPTCKATNEVDYSKPIEEWKMPIRGYKVEHSGHWWSQCLVCEKEGRESWFPD